MSRPLPSVAFLGAGSMGGAILRGLVADGPAVEGGVFATNRTTEKAAALADLPGVTSIALADEPEGNMRAAAAARIVLVGVKPAMVPALLAEVAPVLRDDAVVVSLAAGVTLETFQRILGDGVSVLRSMPNTPSLVGKGVTGLARGAAATDEDAALVRELFAAVGTVIEVPEERIDALSAISGSGPAYVFLLIEELTRAAAALGFDEGDARRMVEGTFIGAAALLDASDEEPAELRRRVTSPKGTTERAVAVLQEAELATVFQRAADAAIARAKELAAGA
ncbi:pyrroline-5-carboxylate reductase [Microbacterium oryzae]|uniref:pyrroline-5-carboxylate reductase n=1 Tax=Microbacterium oryzae TaxID=743009 RepID=UPI0025B1DA17|nr:pyrroline-5-carboxylate reductase [Microbacterium oryzae]MDN3311210.1 pyrroline-5-carboxylate reductase [Microbacterium oryzae]